MAIIPEQFQQKLDYVLQQNMSYETLSATNRANVTRKIIEVLQELSQPSRFDNYIDVMQKYIDLAQKYHLKELQNHLLGLLVKVGPRKLTCCISISRHLRRRL